MVYTAEIVLNSRVRSSQDVNARERVRLAIRDRLNAIGMTGRAFGKAFSANSGKGHVDTWVSSLLKGQFALSLDELDEAARILKTTTATLVKHPLETAEYLTPTEHRILEAVRLFPASIRDHFLTLAEYLVGIAPSEIDHLMAWRELTQTEQERFEHLIRATRIAREPLPGLSVLPDSPERDERPTVEVRRIRGQQRRKRFER